MRDIFLRKSFILSTLVITLLYLAITIWLMNLQLVSFTLTASYPLLAKLQILYSLLGGLFTSMTPFSLFLLFLSALLTGANLTLIYQKISFLRQMGNIKLSVGGGLILGIVGSGCSACGLPILSLVGLSGSLTFLPLQGGELAFISVILLAVSLYFLTKSIYKTSCDIPQSLVEPVTPKRTHKTKRL